MKTVKILLNKYADSDSIKMIKISGKRIPKVKTVNLSFNIGKDNENSFEIITTDKTYTGEIVGHGLHLGGVLNNKS